MTCKYAPYNQDDLKKRRRQIYIRDDFDPISEDKESGFLDAPSMSEVSTLDKMPFQICYALYWTN